MPGGRPKKEVTLSNAERKQRHRALARRGKATAEAIDAELLKVFRQAYEITCKYDAIVPTVKSMVDAVLSRFPADDAERVRLRLGMPPVQTAMSSTTAH